MQINSEQFCCSFYSPASVWSFGVLARGKGDTNPIGLPHGLSGLCSGDARGWAVLLDACGAGPALGTTVWAALLGARDRRHGPDVITLLIVPAISEIGQNIRYKGLSSMLQTGEYNHLRGDSRPFILTVSDGTSCTVFFPFQILYLNLLAGDSPATATVTPSELCSWPAKWRKCQYSVQT